MGKAAVTGWVALAMLVSGAALVMAATFRLASVGLFAGGFLPIGDLDFVTIAIWLLGAALAVGGVTVALVGLAANLVSLALLRSGQGESLNVRGAYLEVLGDTLGSIAVIVAAVVIATSGWTGADVVASFVVGALVLPRAWSLLRDALDVLLEAAPRGVDLDDVRRHVLGVEGVTEVHDLHAWTITSGLPVLSAHVVVEDAVLADGHGGRVLDALCACLGSHFDVEHCTFQLESASHRGHESPVHD